MGPSPYLGIDIYHMQYANASLFFFAKTDKAKQIMISPHTNWVISCSNTLTALWVFDFTNSLCLFSGPGPIIIYTCHWLTDNLLGYAEYPENAKYEDWLKQSTPGSVVPLAMFNSLRCISWEPEENSQGALSLVNFNSRQVSSASFAVLRLHSISNTLAEM